MKNKKGVKKEKIILIGIILNLILAFITVVFIISLESNLVSGEEGITTSKLASPAKGGEVVPG